jgi:hypothetical protein
MASSNRLTAVARWLIVWFVAFDVAFLWQKLGRADESEFGAHPDEAAHYVTGLFVRDAIATLPQCLRERSLKPLEPFRSKDAEDGFYAHYPKVALGVWPPAFYVVQSAWTFPFGVSRTSILLLMAVLAAATATLIYRALWREFGDWPAAAASLLWLCGPLVRESYGMVMAEMLSALTMFAATLAWGRFLDERRTGDAIAFGFLAAAAILTKGTGLALVLMCAFSIAFTGRWKILAARGTWLGIVLVALLAGPWTWYFRNEGTRVGGWADNSGGFSFDFTKRAVVYYAEKLVVALSIAVAVFAVAGIILRAFKKDERQGRWAALAALVVGVFVFQALMPVGYEARHILSATPALVVLAFGGARAIGGLRALRIEGPEQLRRDRLWLILLLLLSFAPMAWPIVHYGVEKKACTGFQLVAEELLDIAPPRSRILVSSDASGEGMLISEIAMRDQRPNLFIERGSTALVSESSKKWDGRNLRSRFLDDDELLAFLTAGKFEYIVLDDAVPEPKRAEYHDQLRRVINDHIGTIFFRYLESPVMRHNDLFITPIRVYRIRGR